MRCLLLLLLLVSTVRIDAQKYWGTLERGRYAVGFTIASGESGPGASGTRPRPIEIAVWYPSNDARGEAMTFGDYVRAAPDLRRRSGSIDDVIAALSAAITGDAAALPREQVQAILDELMFARRDAKATSKRFPVVLWSARYGTTAAQSVLSEYLASHGHVVVFARPTEAQERLPFELTTADEKLAELNAQVDDLRGALRFVRALPYADPERTAVVAWSYAGESATRLQLSDARVGGVIGLSTNLLANWVYQPQESLEPEVPYVSLTEKEDGPFRALAHGNFNTIEGMIPAVEGITRVQRWSRAGREMQAGYESVARAVKNALRACWKRRARFRTIELTAGDGVRVTADLHRAASRARCILAVHQSGSSRGEFRSIAPRLTALGYDVLAIDARWGRRDRWNDVRNETARRFGTIEIVDRGDTAAMKRIVATNDIAAASDWLEAQGCRSMILWGSSLHANAVLERAVANKAAAVVAFSPGEYDRDAPEKMRTIVRALAVPVFIAWGAGEEAVAQPVHDAIPASLRTAYLSRARHGSAILFEDAAAWRSLREFLKTLPR
jgi:dienelactone hydrolase